MEEREGEEVEDGEEDDEEGLTIEQRLAKDHPEFAQALAARGAAIRLQSSFRGMKGRELEQDKRRAHAQIERPDRTPSPRARQPLPPRASTAPHPPPILRPRLDALLSAAPHC